ncbi:hypothetical protein C1I98_09660 [Spongiactinospora gelatinilytica]|uniref:Uncharacterized protein n=1 Tax=Spongiactinospora gelatinilytica TaxID=2666298 RepID=A0A2W2GTB9_9ACTN|nr:hypothetical protein [Spongiactinospora gelatinilytica]PZG50983.1 hypothetical protein C1I98_09660 [Spongiactinospora gelatinilytica]
MRHFLGLLLGVVLTAGILGGAGWAAAWALGEGHIAPLASGPELWTALGVMAGIGLILGLVVAGRVSPLATFVPSLALLAWTVVYALDMNRAVSLIPVGNSTHPLLAQVVSGCRLLLASGVFALLGVLLFIPVLLPSRWAGRHEEKEEEDYEESQEGAYY